MTKPAPQLEFDAILRNTHHRIRADIAGLGVAMREVDEIAQDVYLELHRHVDRLPEDVAPQRWLTGIARNVCVNHIRRSTRRGRLQREALAEILADVETESHRHATAGTLAPALEECRRQLPEESRKLLELRYQQGLSSSAIAEVLGQTAEAISAMLFRLRAGLKACALRQIAGRA